MDILKIKNRVFLLSAFLLVASSAPVLAQLSIDRILVSGQEDARNLTETYIAPLAKGFGSGFNNGWYISAKPHESLGFNLTISMSASLVPDEDEYFTFRNEDYTNIRLTDSNLTQAESPTVMGPASPGPNVTVYNDAFGANVPLDNFDMAEGIGMEDALGFNAVPAPMVTLGVGIVKNTDLVIRFVPELKSDDGSFFMYGVGVKHDLKQHIPVVNALPFELSFFGGYTKLDGELNLAGTFDGTDQRGTLDVEAKTVQLLAGKTIGILNLYAGLGYDFTRTDTKILGEYILSYSSVSNFTLTITDPVDFSVHTNSLRATAGFGLKLGPIVLNGDYSIAEYHTATVGLSASFN